MIGYPCLLKLERKVASTDQQMAQRTPAPTKRAVPQRQRAVRRNSKRAKQLNQEAQDRISNNLRNKEANTDRIKQQCSKARQIKRKTRKNMTPMELDETGLVIYTDLDGIVLDVLQTFIRILLQFTCNTIDWAHSKLVGGCRLQDKQGNHCGGRLALLNQPGNNIQGLHVHFSVFCHKCLCESEFHNYRHKKVNTHREINIRSVMSHHLSGQDYASVRLHQNLLLGKHRHSGMWNRISDKLWDAVVLEFDKTAEEIQSLVRRSGAWSLALDMGWLTRGKTSKHGSLPAIWFEENKILLHVTRSKNSTYRERVTRPCGPCCS